MPQLSIETYITQYLWLVIVLGVFYYYISTQIVPKIGEIKKTRARISSETPSSSPVFTATNNTNIQLGSTIVIKKGGETKGIATDIFENMNKEWIKK